MLVAATGAADNLIVNSGFEEPGTANSIPGWTFWRADWGSGEVAETTTSKKVSGSRALTLTCSSASFGVYQEVTVTPGRAYQMNGWWQGSFPSGYPAWYDCELLNGPFDIVLADQRPDDLPYKTCTYDIAQAPWDWERMSDAYHTTVPLLGESVSITRNGIRVASTDKLTVVLKTGGFNHPAGCYDDISLEEVPEMSIADAKKQSDGIAVMITDNIVTAIFPGQVYVQSQDRVSGVRVDADVIRTGIDDLSKVAGVLRTSADGERYIESSYVYRTGAGAARPLAMAVDSLSASASDTPSTIGLLVRVSGSARYIDSHTFEISDGSGVVRCVTPVSVVVDPSWRFACVTGISTCCQDDDGPKRLLRVRRGLDITTVEPQ